MDSVMALAGLAAVMALSLGLALGLEWLCLRGALLLLPSPAAQAERAALARMGSSSR